MVKGVVFHPQKARKAHEIKGFEHLTKHRYAIWSTRKARMMRLLRKHEAKRTLTSPWAEGSLHRAKPCFIFHAPQVRFISKTKSTARAVLTFLFLKSEKELVKIEDVLYSIKPLILIRIFLRCSVSGNSTLPKIRINFYFILLKCST